MTTGNVLGDAFNLLIDFGFLRIVVPFILFYSIVFGMLERTQLFTRREEGGKLPKEIDKQVTNMHAMIAFAIAITATAASQAVGITTNYLPILAIVAVIIVGVMLLLGLAFGEEFSKPEFLTKHPIYTAIVWTGAIALLFGAIIAVGYYSGLVVTPCDGTLTPVNTLNTREGECTRLFDITQLTETGVMYMMGVEVQTGSLLTGLGVAAVIIFIIWYIYKLGK
ncbi:Uncharacterised protein [Candidatus Tiddalikarchaeum anstoanum]|nr:Uncharacterised protein [Candidatus Tiddalikarchaeum anstoanum]